MIENQPDKIIRWKIVNCVNNPFLTPSLSLPPSLLVFVVGANTTEENAKINVFFLSEESAPGISKSVQLN